MNRELLRRLPKVDEVLADEILQGLEMQIPHRIIVQAVRDSLDVLRETILSDQRQIDPEELQISRVAEQALRLAEASGKATLRPVINATGIVLHTNLGRARLSAAAEHAVHAVSGSYSTLEYDLQAGKRGSRHTHVEQALLDITGAEDAMVVNNNAAATMLCLSAIGRGKEIIVSRGELVEIGGSFRIPEIMEQSGAHLVEVGTTNKTRIEDYARRISEETGALLKVHTSNYRIMGFTEEASLEELVALGKREGLPVIYDMGCGLMVSLEELGIHEPTVPAAMRSGIDVILFSGDKLLGGPQAGIIAGKREYIEKMKQHPLARVLRVDKMTLAALEATLKAYYDLDKAKQEIPVLADLFLDEGQLKNRAERLQQRLTEECGDAFCIRTERTTNRVGGGSVPMAELCGYAVSLRSALIRPNELEQRLRLHELPIIARIAEDKLYLEMRTLTEGDVRIIGDVLVMLAAELKKGGAKP